MFEVPGYELLDPLGQGGFATVYRANQIAVGREVAIKIDNRLLIEERDRRRFFREVNAAGQLSGHPHVVDVYDAGTLPDRRPYLVMELCPNGSLADQLRSRGSLPPGEVRDIGVRIADAVAAAHDAGVLHRDIKPANILINRYKMVGLADFGLASIMRPDAAQSATREALTPAYAAPEVFLMGEPSHAADIYSLAATLYALLSGRPARFPQTGSPSIATIIGLHHEPIPDIPGMPSDLVAVLREAMASEPSQRIPSAAMFRDALSDVRIDPATISPAQPRDPNQALVPTADPQSLPPSSGPPGRSQRIAPVAYPNTLTSSSAPPYVSGPSSAPPNSAPPNTAPPYGSPAYGSPPNSAPPYQGPPPNSAPPYQGPPATPQYPGGPPYTGQPQSGAPYTGQPSYPYAGGQPQHYTGQPSYGPPPQPAPPAPKYPWKIQYVLSFIFVILVVAAPFVYYKFLPGYAGNPTSGDSASASPSADAYPVATIDCQARAFGGRCTKDAECWGGMVVINGTVSMNRRSCEESHNWETFAIALMAPDSATFNQDDLAAQPAVKRLCNRSLVKILARYSPAAKRAKPADWQIEVVPPTEASFQAGARHYRCMATYLTDIDVGIKGNAFRPT